ncbi:MAG: hypothetical protein ACYC77_07890 [Coriobacteriia bacterium]
MRSRIGLVLVAFIALVVSGGCSTVPAPPEAAPADVIVIVTDTLTWADVDSDEMPVTAKFAQDAALGLVVARDAGASGALDVFGGGGGREIGSHALEGTPAEMDRGVAEAIAGSPAGATIAIVSAPTASSPGIVLLTGDGYGPGLLESASTRRAGIVTAHDVSATVSRAAGATLVAEAGAPAGVTADGRTPAERLQHMVRFETFLGSMERIRVPVQSAYTAAMAMLILGGWLVAEKGRAGSRFGYWSTVLRRALLFGLCVPGAATLLLVVDRYPASPERAVSLLLAAGGSLWLFSQFAWHKWGTAGAVAFAGIVTAAILVIDQLLGAPLSVSGLFSYSPVGAFRFFGMGNEGAAIVVGALLTGIALELDAAPADARARRAIIVFAGIAAVFVPSAPFLGANAIVAVWGTVAFVALFIAAERRPLHVFDVVVTAVCVVLAVGAVVLLDRLVPGVTHITRAVGDSGAGLLELFVERARTSLIIFTRSALPVPVLLVAAGFAYLRFRPRGRFKAVLERYPTFAAAITAGLIAGALGAVVEDSGVVILALILTYLAGDTVMLMLVPDAEEGPAR